MLNAQERTGNPGSSGGDDLKVIRPIRWGTWIAAAAVILALFGIAWLFATGQIQWPKVIYYLFDPMILEGLWGTLFLTVIAMALGIFVGVVMAVMRQSSNPVVQSTAAGYIWLFRAIPSLVQLMLWFNLGLIAQQIGIPGLLVFDTNEVMTPLLAATLGLGLSEGAYMAEIIRGGINSVPRGQIEAAKALGMPSGMIMNRVILPQTIRVVLPPTGNQVISMLKYTSLAFAVTYSELLTQARKIYAQNFMVIETLLAITIWYLILVAVLSFLQTRIERYFAFEGVRPAGRRERSQAAVKEVSS